MNQAKSNVLPFKGEDALGPGLNADDIPIETDYTHQKNSNNGGGGDGMDYVLRRIEKLEDKTDKVKDGIGDLKVMVSRIESTLPHVAKQEDLVNLKTKVNTLEPHLATKTWIANRLILLFFGLVAQMIFTPLIQHYLQGYNSSPAQASVQSKQHNK
jgi:hypothetical protein